MRFSEKLREQRKSRGYTQEELAEKLGVSRQAIARWESGETTPDMELLIRICAEFSVSADYMIHDDYESDEDIPAVREKKDEIISAGISSRRTLLVTAVVFAVSAFCWFIATLTAHPGNMLLCGLCFAVNGALSALKFFQYFRK